MVSGDSLPFGTGLAPGTLLDGKYEIVSHLGTGGMGEVYKVRHVHLNAFRCVKIVRRHLFDDDSYRSRFLREARLATQIHHPNVALVHDFSVVEDGTSYMVTEFIDGTTVRQWSARNGRFPIDLAVEVCTQVLAGLGHIHRLGLLHRDISADNIMLTTGSDRRIVAKIIDLGVAKDTTGTADGTTQTQVGMLIGNPKYMSPEQLGELGEGEQLDGRADLYSLGVVLYEMLLGVPPFIARTPNAYIVKHLTEPPQRFRAVEPGDTGLEAIEPVVLRALEKRRERRYRDAADFATALEPFREPLSTFSGEAAAAPTIPDGRLEVPTVVVTQDHPPAPTGKEVERDFQAAWEAGTTPAWRGFLAKHASTALAARARDLLDEAEAFESACRDSSETGLREFLKRWPESRHRLDAEIQLVSAKKRRAADAFQQAAAAGTYEALRDFVARYPSADETDAARQLLADAAAFETTATLDTEDAWKEFIASNPAPRFLEKAQERLREATRREDEAWKEATESGTSEGWREFVRRFADSRRAPRAERHAREVEAWEKAVHGSRAELEEFVRLHPEGLFAREAKRLLKQRSDDDDFAHAAKLGSASALRLYLASQPAGAHREEAQLRIAQLEDIAYATVLASRDADKATDFLHQFPDSPRRAEIERLVPRWRESRIVTTVLGLIHAGEADQAAGMISLITDPERRSEAEKALESLRDDRAWEVAKASDTLAGFQKYAENWPQGRWLKEAKKRISRAQEKSASAEPRDWERAWEAGTTRAWDEYLAAHPESLRIKEARLCRQEAQEYELACQLDSPKMWRLFVKSWPDGRHRLDAELKC